MFLLIDNYDSFTFNLVQYFQMIGHDPVVLRNEDERIIDAAKDPALKMVCISPGPSRPENAGLCLTFLEKLPKTTPVMGVCLGHQILGHFAGAPCRLANAVMHGKTSVVEHDGKGLFTGIENPFTVCRYHSLAVPVEYSDKIEVTAHSEDGEIMGLRYKDRPWEGLQFHPESILTEHGMDILRNFPNQLEHI